MLEEPILQPGPSLDELSHILVASGLVKVHLYRRLQIPMPFFESHPVFWILREQFFMNFAGFPPTNHASILCKYVTNNIV